jgi:hypothetical protein
VEHVWIEEYQLVQSDFDITNVDPELVSNIPSPLEMGAVYQRLITDTLTKKKIMWKELSESIMRQSVK